MKQEITFKTRAACFTLELPATPPRTGPASHPTTLDTHELLGAEQGAPDGFDGPVRLVPSRRTAPAPILPPQTVQTTQGPGTQTVPSPTTLQMSSLQASPDATPRARAEHVSRAIRKLSKEYATRATPPSPVVRSIRPQHARVSTRPPPSTRSACASAPQRLRPHADESRP